MTDPKTFYASLRHLENIASGLERTHPDGSCHGYASRILDCVQALRGNEAPVVDCPGQELLPGVMHPAMTAKGTEAHEDDEDVDPITP